MKKYLIAILIATVLLAPYSVLAVDPPVSNTSTNNIVSVPISGELSPPTTPPVTEGSPVVVTEPKPLTVCPQGHYCLLEPLPNIPSVSQNSQCVIGDGTLLQCINFTNFVEYVFKFMIALSVFLATIMIIYGGFSYMLSEVPFVKANAKSTITNAVWGLLFALSSYLILQTIDPRLVQVNTTIPAICVGDKVLNDEKSICYKKGHENLQKAFSDQLKAISAAERKAVYDLQQKVMTRDQRIEEIESMRAYGPLTPEMNLELEQLKYANQTEMRTINEKVANTILHTQFRHAMNSLHAAAESIKEVGTIPLTPDTLKLLEESRHAISNPDGPYQKAMTEVNKNPEASRVWRIREKFYLEQMKVEEEFTLLIRTYTYRKILYGASARDTRAAKENLEEFIKTNSQIDTQVYGKASPEIRQEFEVLTNLRQEKVNKLFAPPEKK